MKKMKKLASLVLALAMALTLAVPAMAAGTYSITIENSASGHTYEAYQIFKGDLHNGTLSNIQWGSGVSAHADKSAASVAEKLDENYTGDDKLTADGLLDMITLSSICVPSTQSDGNYVISNLEAGYYLIKDKDNTLAGGNDAYTEYIIKVVGNVTTAPKADVPEVEKKVKDINDSDADETSGKAEYTDWQDSADYDIGDNVPFQLTATLANNVESYSKYKVVFHDTLSTGLTYNDDAKVYFGRTEVTESFTITESNGKLTISCDNVKDFGATNNSVITVEYTATLNNNAVIGSAGNPNEVYLEYSNNPNYTGDGANAPTGNTPEDKVIVFTYQVVVNKTDAGGNPLPGAGFTLYKKQPVKDETGNVVENEDGTVKYDYQAVGSEVTGAAMTTFEWKGLDDGDYKLVETTTPAGYNTIDPIEFTITAEHDVESDNPTLISLTGGDKFTGELSTGTLTASVVNKSGATLPETGGMGTTLFYILGGVLVIGAGVAMVTKKRMG